MSGGKAVLI